MPHHSRLKRTTAAVMVAALVTGLTASETWARFGRGSVRHTTVRTGPRGGASVRQTGAAVGPRGGVVGGSRGVAVGPRGNVVGGSRGTAVGPRGNAVSGSRSTVSTRRGTTVGGSVHYSGAGGVRYSYRRVNVSTLPRGYHTLAYGGVSYAYYPRLPVGYSTVVLRGVTYYTAASVWYRQYYYGGNVVYIVVDDPNY